MNQRSPSALPFALSVTAFVVTLIVVGLLIVPHGRSAAALVPLLPLFVMLGRGSTWAAFGLFGWAAALTAMVGWGALHWLVLVPAASAAAPLVALGLVLLRFDALATVLLAALVTLGGGLGGLGLASQLTATPLPHRRVAVGHVHGGTACPWVGRFVRSWQGCRLTHTEQLELSWSGRFVAWQKDCRETRCGRLRCAAERTVDSGEARVTDDGDVLLVSDGGSPAGHLPQRTIPASWGERRYLVDASAIERFCRAARDGRQPETVRRARAYLHEDDRDRPIHGMPDICASSKRSGR